MRRFAEENRAEAEAAADCFFDDAQTFDRAIAFGSALRVGKCLTHLFDQGIVAAIDASEALVRGRSRFRGSRHLCSRKRQILNHQEH